MQTQGQNLSQCKCGHGGRHAGAGRKKLPPEKKKVRLIFYALPQTAEKIRVYAQKLIAKDDACGSIKKQKSYKIKEI